MMHLSGSNFSAYCLKGTLLLHRSVLYRSHARWSSREPSPRSNRIHPCAAAGQSHHQKENNHSHRAGTTIPGRRAAMHRRPPNLQSGRVVAGLQHAGL